MRNKLLEDLIYEYIKNHERDHVDTVDLVSHFKNHSPEEILTALKHLRVNKCISRVSIGIHYKFIIRNATSTF